MPVNSVNSKGSCYAIHTHTHTHRVRAYEDCSLLEVQMGWGCTEKRNIVPWAICWTVILPPLCLSLRISLTCFCKTMQKFTSPHFINVCLSFLDYLVTMSLWTCDCDPDRSVRTCWCTAVTCSGVHTHTHTVREKDWGAILRKKNCSVVLRFTWMGLQQIRLNETFWFQFPHRVSKRCSQHQSINLFHVFFSLKYYLVDTSQHYFILH